jgi:hypothetical protein
MEVARKGGVVTALVVGGKQRVQTRYLDGTEMVRTRQTCATQPARSMFTCLGPYRWKNTTSVAASCWVSGAARDGEHLEAPPNPPTVSTVRRWKIVKGVGLKQDDGGWEYEIGDPPTQVSLRGRPLSLLAGHH